MEESPAYLGYKPLPFPIQCDQMTCWFLAIYRNKNLANRITIILIYCIIYGSQKLAQDFK